MTSPSTPRRRLRRFLAVSVAAATLAATVPAAAPAHAPHASDPPNRVAVVDRVKTTASSPTSVATGLLL
jgi:hypothetical protein